MATKKTVTGLGFVAGIALVQAGWAPAVLNLANECTTLPPPHDAGQREQAREKVWTAPVGSTVGCEQQRVYIYDHWYVYDIFVHCSSAFSIALQFFLHILLPNEQPSSFNSHLLFAQTP